jgi:hypothetical protein
MDEQKELTEAQKEYRRLMVMVAYEEYRRQHLPLRNKKRTTVR